MKVKIILVMISNPSYNCLIQKVWSFIAFRPLNGKAIQAIAALCGYFTLFKKIPFCHQKLNLERYGY